MGLGAIGQAVARAALRNEEVRLVGAVDVDPKRVGKPLSEVLGAPAGALTVKASLEEAVGRTRGAVLLHATQSRLPQVMDQLLAALRLGMSVVSTCEELAFPWLRHPELAEKLERAARAAGGTVLGTGVNPGFVMDRLVATLGTACGEVRHVRVERVVDARTRRPALQRKIGAGMTEDAFMAAAEQDAIGHVGLVESAALAALGLGLDCDDFEEELLPVIAEEEIRGGTVVVKPGHVAGIHQVATGLWEGKERVRLELTLALGAEGVGDRVVLDADPPVEMELKGGLAGDVATANLVVNAAPRITAAEPGILTVLELPAGR
jgi:4-hydroxy-tetrahydrodipicolinate reductase